MNSRKKKTCYPVTSMDGYFFLEHLCRTFAPNSFIDKNISKCGIEPSDWPISTIIDTFIDKNSE